MTRNPTRANRTPVALWMTLALAAPLAAVLAVVGPAGAAAPFDAPPGFGTAEGPVFHATFENSSDPYRDVSGNGYSLHDVTLYSSTYSLSADGGLGSGQFQADLPGLTEYTVAVRGEASAAGAIEIDEGYDHGWFWEWAQGTTALSYYNDAWGEWVDNGGCALPAGTIDAAAVVTSHDGLTDVTVYVNGVECQQVTFAARVANYVFFGYDAESYDNAILYSRALSLDEIDALPNSYAFGGTPPATPDTTAPVVADVSDIVAEATSSSGARVNFTAPTWTDDVDGSGTATCDAASGATFALGTTTVTCSHTDAAGNLGSSSFDVTVQDTTAPAVAPVAGLVAEATGPSGAPVTFTAPTWTDAVDGSGTSACDPASGSTFALGETTVLCGVTDAAGNMGSSSFVVDVVDTTPPTVDAHDLVFVETTGSDAVVTYVAPATHDLADGDGAATCVPASGDTFPVGYTDVTCTATDAHGNSAEPSTFTVQVAKTPSVPTPELPSLILGGVGLVALAMLVARRVR